jgi:hypothetical protein
MSDEQYEWQERIRWQGRARDGLGERDRSSLESSREGSRGRSTSSTSPFGYAALGTVAALLAIIAAQNPVQKGKTP